MTLQELEKIKEDNEITYNDLLQCIEWKNRRSEIIERDNNKCRNCGKTKTGKIFSGTKVIYLKLDKEAIENGENVVASEPVHLEVHHKYYVLNREPWNYKNDALLTVCRECHEDIHSKTKIEVYDEKMVTKLEFGVCSRCSGKGNLTEYNHIQGGVCFKCGGSGINIPFKYNGKK